MPYAAVQKYALHHSHHVKMNLQRFETGIQRAYYVAWAGLVAVALFGAVMNMAQREDPFLMTPYVREDIFILVVTIVGPLVVMHLVRWIYRGFFPKANL